MPKRMQYNAANMGNGIDANTAPNFPEMAKLSTISYLEATKCFGSSRSSMCDPIFVLSACQPNVGDVSIGLVGDTANIFQNNEV
jgi:hypothetical protein